MSSVCRVGIGASGVARQKHKKRVYAFGRNRIAHLETSNTKSKPNRQHVYCQRATRTSEKLRVERLLNPLEAWLDPIDREARAPVFRERLERALKTGRYPALCGDIDNPHKKSTTHSRAASA